MLSSFQTAIVAALQKIAVVPLTADGTWTTDSTQAVDVDEVVIVQEDSGNVEAQLQNALGEQGMVVLAGQASEKNTGVVLTGPAEMTISMQVAVGESPTVWRMTNGKKNSYPTAQQMADLIVAGLQGLVVPNMKPVVVEDATHVPDKKRNLYNIQVRAKAIVKSAQYQ